ncbi:MAG: hypothetical protein ACP5UH_03145 [Candidatus Micrarchaeia archaeon]
MDIEIIRMASVLAIALIYMLFDLFNKRNVPDIFAYATLAYGLALTLLYMGVLSLASIAIAALVLGFGYLIYKAGQIGAADIIEFAALSLVMPIQPVPWLTSLDQLGLPFILSVLIGAGVAALIIAPIYYLLLSKSRSKRSIIRSVDAKSTLKSLIILAAYVAFMVFAKLVMGIDIYALAILLVLAVFSSLIVLFESAIASAMIKYVRVGDFEEGDIIALNFMDPKKVARIKARIKGMDRLVTRKLIKELKSKHISDRFPVYKNAMPMALPVFIGVLLALSVGDIILFIFPPIMAPL